MGAFLALLALLFPQTSQPLPFDAAAKAVLDVADRARGKAPIAPKNVVARLAPLHERVRLGALELWWPTKSLNERLAPRSGPDAQDCEQLARDLVALQGAWIERMPASSEDRARAREAREVLARWTAAFVGSKVPELSDEVRSARSTLERFFHRRELDERAPAVVAIVAPTRAQFLGLLGAASEVDPALGPQLRVERQRRASSAQLVPGVMVLARSSVAEGERASPLKDIALDPEDARQLDVHAASHLLSVAFTPAAPAWWGEGLALHDTITTCGADETLCSGCGDTNSLAGVPIGGSALEILLWVTRHKSPFRGGSSREHFAAALRAALSPDGLALLDLDRGELAGRVAPRMLAERASAPALVLAGPPGVKKGHAELYRAWCGAFVHWLSTQRLKDEALLDALSRELAREPWDPSRKRSALHELCARVCGRTLGASDDPALDLEAAFAASLQR